ncbi:MAG TPA: sugar ABC transporter substrate-binding protein, partial [Arthrobacter sp.]|nr:sugar ABC transporter substrate-binding protein [Arthrobacter sp.]
PAGPAGSKPYNIPSWGLAVNEASGNQDNAWKFIQWATSKERTLEAQKAGVPGPRASVWADPAGTSTYPADLAEAIAASAKNGVGHDRPEVVTVGKAREIVGGPIVATITGEDASAAADTAHEAFQKFLDSEKK